MKKISVIAMAAFMLSLVSCDPYEDFNPGVYTARKNISIENQSHYNLVFLHISSGLYVQSGDSTIFSLEPGEVYNDWVQVKDRNIHEYLKEEWNRDLDTLKVFRNNELLKTYHGPLVDESDEFHSPYCTQNWRVIEQHDSTSIRFTFTDKDFE